MRRLLIISMALSAIWCEAQMPSVVSAPVLEGYMTEQMAWEIDDRVRKTLSSTITGLQSVQSFVNRANEMSCVSVDFSQSIELADRYGFSNCYIENKANGIGNDMMMVMDMANSAMSIALVAEPQQRLEMIDRAINKYSNIEGDMWELINMIYWELRKRKRKQEQMEEIENLSYIPLTPSEISGKRINIPPPRNLDLGENRDSGVYSSSGGNIPTDFSFRESFTTQYGIINIIWQACMAIGLISVVWAYSNNKQGANAFLIAFVVAVVVGNIIKALIFV